MNKWIPQTPNGSRIANNNRTHIMKCHLFIYFHTLTADKLKRKNTTRKHKKHTNITLVNHWPNSIAHSPIVKINFNFSRNTNLLRLFSQCLILSGLFVVISGRYLVCEVDTLAFLSLRSLILIVTPMFVCQSIYVIYVEHNFYWRTENYLILRCNQ